MVNPSQFEQRLACVSAAAREQPHGLRRPALRGLRSTAAAMALTLWSLAGCGGGNASRSLPPPTGVGDGPTQLAFTTALQGDSSGITARETVVLQDAGQWGALWARHASFMVPTPPAPVQDFSDRQMVGLFVGSRPNGCSSVAVTAVIQQGQTVTVHYQEKNAGSGEVCTQAVTQPHHLVWMPRSSLPVQFMAE